MESHTVDRLDTLRSFRRETAEALCAGPAPRAVLPACEPLLDLAVRGVGSAALAAGRSTLCRLGRLRALSLMLSRYLAGEFR